ncbi:MAG: hypothetical protein ACKVQU_00845 [Burkholderiales bacterium]
MIPITLHSSMGMRALLGILMMISCGTAHLALRTLRRSWPRRVDPEGITLTDGRRFDWSELCAVQPLNVFIHGIPVARRIDLVFRDTTVQVFPESYREGRRVLAFLERRLDTKLVF